MDDREQVKTRRPFEVVSNTGNDCGKAQQKSIPNLSGKRILLVEDNLTNQLIGQKILDKTQATVMVADNGVRALEILAQQHVDLVLMDIQMPLMDGYETTLEIRKNSQWQHLPIFAITANAMWRDVEKSREAGMDAHFSKPYNPYVLYEYLVEFLR